MEDFLQNSLQSGLFRTFWVSTVAFVLSMLLVPFWTNILFKYRFWKKLKQETLYGAKAETFQKLHGDKHKRNIPTMAGLLFWIVVLVVTLAFNLTRSQTWLPLFALVTVGILGAVDDWINIRGLGGLQGIRARHKMFWLTAIGLVGAWWFFSKLGFDTIHVPSFGDITLGLWMVPLFLFIMLAVTNAINITDGLDGLAGGILVIAFGSYGVLALANSQFSLAIFCGTAVGALLAYLWFNIYPMRFLGGDTYALGFGAALSVVAMLIDKGVGIVVLPFLLFVPLIETLSVILQMTYRKLFGRKLFKIAPLHHHFEALGWPETKVTMRMWVIAAVMAILGLAIGLLGKG